MSKPYYNRYQRADYIKLEAIKNVIDKMHKDRNVFLQTGLDDAADRVWQQIWAMQKQRDALQDKMIKDREAMSASLIEVILIANLAYAKAMEFSELVKKCTGDPEDALANDVKRIVDVCQEIALSIDIAGTSKQTKAFSDVIDQLETKYNEQTKPIIAEVMKMFRKSKRFRHLF